MELNYAFLANSAEVGPDGRFFVLGGGLDGLTVSAFPAFLPTIAIVASIHFLPSECGRDYEFRATVTRPDESDLGVRANTMLQPRVPPETPPGLGPNLKVAMSLFSMPVPLLGRYRVNFFVGDQQIGALDLHVAAVQQVVDKAPSAADAGAEQPLTRREALQRRMPPRKALQSIIERGRTPRDPWLDDEND